MLVEGSGPAASPYQGQGWGGGGARYGERYGRGLQGLVLVEIQSGGSHGKVTSESKDQDMNWPPVSSGTLASFSQFDLTAFIAGKF